MSQIERFQSEFGARWASIAADPAFNSALLVCNSEAISRIASLTDEEIELHGKLILADLRGMLRHEEALFTLAERKELNPAELGEPNYPPPEDDLELDNPAPDETTTGNHAATFSESIYFVPPPAEPPLPPKPTRKPRRKRRKKRKPCPPKPQ